jgi:HEAT repeat protein
MGATSLAGEPGLFERVRSVMNRRLNRSPLGWGGVLLIGLLALLVTGPIATAWTTQPWSVPPVEALIQQLRDDGDPLARRRAAWALGERESCAAVAPLVAALEDPSVDVRLAACWALGEIKDEAAVEGMIRTLETDADPLVREAAALALGEVGHPSPVKALTAAVEREEDLREAVVWALGEILDDSASEAREKLCASWQKEPGPHAQVWTGELETADVFSTDVGGLVLQLHADEAYLRRLAACNLGLLGMLDLWESWNEVDVAVDQLLDCLQDPAPDVRAMAIWSLDEINPSHSIRDWRRSLVESTLNECRLNQLGYYLLYNGMIEQALEVFRTNVQLNPRSPNCYDSLGEGYMIAGETELAILNYEKSLNLGPDNTNAVQRLNELRGIEQPLDGVENEVYH